MMYNDSMNQSLQNFIAKKYIKPGKALDLGAGQFEDVKGLSKLGWKAEGVDINMGVNLEESFLSKEKPFDLVYSNYLIHKLKNLEVFIETIYNNLTEGGYFFIHTFDKSDENSKSELTGDLLMKLLINRGFKDIKVGLFDKYDDAEGHQHMHKILEVTGKK
ncbi:class I SAM-dependent methyltransferase [Patescibacteria group bacterium]|nr:class I SAM-dependent methyltransferase [Patescibacteria group bacterium]